MCCHPGGAFPSITTIDAREKLPASSVQCFLPPIIFSSTTSWNDVSLYLGKVVGLDFGDYVHSLHK